MHARGLVLAALVVVGCYEAPSGNAPCAITCTTSCPGDLMCRNGYCVGDGEECAPAFAQVSVGGGFACAIDDGGALWCWGSNEHHQVTASGEAAVAIATRIGSARWDQISSGGAHVCGISDGRVLCWGANDRGQISAAVTGDVMEPVEIVVSGGPARWTAVAAGFNSTCAIGDGRLYCWGAGDAGQLGIGRPGDVGAPTPVDSELADWTTVSKGWGSNYGHGCAISASTGLWCWGGNSYGELGDGTQTPTDEPVQIALTDAVAAVAASAYSTCATTTGGQLYCWGYGPNHALGDPASIDPTAMIVQTTPALASPETGWTKLSGAENLVCGLRDGEAWCWGYSVTGLAFPDGIWKSTTTTFAQVASGVSDVAIGLNQHLDGEGVVTTDVEGGCYVASGAVRCWGDNRYGQLGQGATTMNALPTEIAGGHRWTTLATGARHACGIEGGQLACWGSTLAGAVDGTVAGTATTSCASATCDAGAPREVRGATAVATGSDHTCALDGTAITCWGDDTYQELGAPGLPAAQVGVPGTWSELFDVHGLAQCARGDAGTECWGSVISTIQPPTHVVELDAMTAIAVGGIVSPGYRGFGCYLDGTHQLACFGDNSVGQYGNGPPPPPATCGNFVCDAGECESCPGDCFAQCPALCGNGLCDAGETSATCSDCGTGPMSQLGRMYQAISVGWDLDLGGALACGVRLDGGVECWGRNHGGMIASDIVPTLGTPAPFIRVPTTIAGLAGCTAVAVGETHACAICGEQISCWGDHRGGAVGSETPTSKPVTVPRPIDLALAPGDRWAQLVSGVGFSCARTEQGLGYCWGSSPHGALGTGATASTIPIVVRTE